MLTYMRKNASSWIIKILFAIIVIVFVFFYGFSDLEKSDRDTVVATVGERTISMAEYSNAYQNMLQFYSQVYKNRLSDEMIEKMGLKQQVLEQLLDREVLLQEAERRNIRVTNEEIQKNIMANPAFQEEGHFSELRYNRLLGANGLSAADYEKDQEKELTLRALENTVKNAVKVSDREIRDAFNLENEKISIEYVIIDPEKIKGKIEITDDEAAAYYDKNKENYRVPENVNVQYIVFEDKVFKNKITVTDKEIQQYYEEDPEEFFVPKKVKARHILFTVNKKDTAEKQEAVEKKALQVLEKINQGGDFAKLAEKHSEDEGTAKNGGDVGYFMRGEMAKPFEEAAFSMKPGETSSLVKTQFGFHIIRVEDVKEAHTKALAEVKNKIEQDIRKDKTLETIRREAKRAFNRLFKSRDLEGYADKNGFKIKTSGLFSYGQSPEDLPGKEQFSKEAFALNVGEISPAFAVKEKYILLKLIERKDSHIPELDKVRLAVNRDLGKERRRELARKDAEEKLTQLQDGSLQWKSLEKKPAREIKETNFKRQGDYIKGIGKAQDIKDAAFAIEQPDTFGPGVYDVTKGIVLFKQIKREIPEESDYEKQKESISRTIVQKKQQEIFEQFLQNLKTDFETKINTKLFSSV